MTIAESHTSRHAELHPADLIEVGRALQTGLKPDEQKGESKKPVARTEQHDVVVVGAGQAGLSVSYHLRACGVDHVVLEAASQIGNTWRNRWDSLRLFTPAKFDGLDGFPFPASKDVFPTKNQMADYLVSYANRFQLPVRLNSPVRKLSKTNGTFKIELDNCTIEAGQVIIAAASYQKPRIPHIAEGISESVPQIHSSEYKNAQQIPGGSVLLVGAGNSGAEIAMDLAGTHDVILAGRDVGHVPFDISGFMGRKLLVRTVIRGMFHHVLTMRTPMGRKFRSKMHNRGMPLIRTRPGQLERAGVKRVGRIASIERNVAETETGDKVGFDSVIWCTGYQPGLDWIDLPIFDENGIPRHHFGKSADVDGLYFAGLHFQYAVSSTMVAGVGRDAKRVARWATSSIAA